MSTSSHVFFINSFLKAVSVAPLQVHNYSKALPTSTNTVLEYHTEAPQKTVFMGTLRDFNTGLGKMYQSINQSINIV